MCLGLENALPTGTLESMQHTKELVTEEEHEEPTQKVSQISELERVHNQCTKKWRQLSAQRRLQQSAPVKRGISKSNTVGALPPRPPTPRGSQQAKAPSPRRAKMDALRKRQAQCLEALKHQEAERAAENASEKAALADLVQRTSEIQVMQENMQQSLQLRNQYEALKSLNAALLSELDTLKMENGTLQQRVKELEEAREASEDELSCCSTISNPGEPAVSAAVSGLSLMSPYASWRRLVSPPSP
mmetsp:Transcript_60647/g.112491  ORF Transcript_60647/g.112491 Transcript_60647/m.112491 type:complete len:245 (-) Transcript_60647:304-1038(-)